MLAMMLSRSLQMMIRFRLFELMILVLPRIGRRLGAWVRVLRVVVAMVLSSLLRLVLGHVLVVLVVLCVMAKTAFLIGLVIVEQVLLVVCWSLVCMMLVLKLVFLGIVVVMLVTFWSIRVKTMLEPLWVLSSVFAVRLEVILVRDVLVLS